MLDDQAFIQKIREAFGVRPYPGDDKIVIDRDDLESMDVAKEFKGRRWEELAVEAIGRNYCSLPLLTTEAFCYYCLPDPGNRGRR